MMAVTQVLVHILLLGTITTSYGNPSQDGLFASVAGDPHVMVATQDNGIVCFDLAGEDGTIVNILQDDGNGLFVLGTMESCNYYDICMTTISINHNGNVLEFNLENFSVTNLANTGERERYRWVWSQNGLDEDDVLSSHGFSIVHLGQPTGRQVEVTLSNGLKLKIYNVEIQNYDTVQNLPAYRYLAVYMGGIDSLSDSLEGTLGYLLKQPLTFNQSQNLLSFPAQPHRSGVPAQRRTRYNPMVNEDTECIYSESGELTVEATMG